MADGKTSRRTQTDFVVVITGKHDHRAAVRRKPLARVEKQFFGFGRRNGGIENVARNQNKVGLFDSRNLLYVL